MRIFFLSFFYVRSSKYLSYSMITRPPIINTSKIKLFVPSSWSCDYLWIKRIKLIQVIREATLTVMTRTSMRTLPHAMWHPCCKTLSYAAQTHYCIFSPFSFYLKKKTSSTLVEFSTTRPFHSHPLGSLTVNWVGVNAQLLWWVDKDEFKSLKMSLFLWVESSLKIIITGRYVPPLGFQVHANNSNILNQIISL